MQIEVRYQAGENEHRTTAWETDEAVVRVEETNGRVKVWLTAKQKLTLLGCSIELPYTYKEGSRIFANGYQSWTDTREFALSEPLHNMNRVPGRIKEKYHFAAYGDAWFVPYRKGQIHSFTYTYVKQPDGRADFIGSYNEANAYLLVVHKKKEQKLSLVSDCAYKVLEAGETFSLYDYVQDTGSVSEVQTRYFAAYGECDVPPIRGYTSWYLHYQDINEQKMEIALASIDKEQFDLFQIDDGYETFVGDWLDIDPVKFPKGLSPLADKIHAKGLKAGIWLAPFVCELKSRVYKEHPDWIYRENGREVFAGSNWSGDVVLDVRKPAVAEYIKNCLRFYADAGFDFFKLDFLYAAALIHEGGTKTRAEMMRGAMEFLRETLGDKLILGCGVPLSSAFHLADYCRIGPDVSLKFDDVFFMRLMHRERISTKMTLQNTIYRSPMDGHVFRCDPDVFLLRDDNIELSAAQKKALVMINHLCGAVYMTSDNVGQYDDQKQGILKEAQSLQNARIEEITQQGDLIRIRYELGGTTQTLCYNRALGVLVEP